MSDKEFNILQSMKKNNEKLIATLKTDEYKNNSMTEGYILALRHQNKNIKQEIRRV